MNAPEEHRFFNRRNESHCHRHWVIHWEQQAVLYFVTWRLKDSLPDAIIQGFYNERKDWLEKHPVVSSKSKEEYRSLFITRFQDWLDLGKGKCILKTFDNAQIVASSLQFFNMKRYCLESFVVMPNHVHVIVQLHKKENLPAIIKSWKGYSAFAINKVIGSKGGVWQRDYWDTMIRNERHLKICRRYIIMNPEKAGLKEGEYILWVRPIET